jgi:CheY-like chemotaxis protein
LRNRTSATTTLIQPSLSIPLLGKRKTGTESRCRRVNLSQQNLLNLSQRHSLNPLFNVQTGEEAIAYLKGDERYANRAEYPLPDLVLLDLKLTGISGFQVLKWIRQQPGLRAMRVVVLTGSTAIEDINLAYQLGANSFLAKPMDFDSFVQVAGAVAGYWIWMNETPEVSRSVEGVKGSGANIGSTSGESLPE